MLESNKDPAAAFKRVCDFRIIAALLLAPVKAPIRNPNGIGLRRPATSPIFVPQMP
jgi:hypothetical protein